MDRRQRKTHALARWLAVFAAGLAIGAPAADAAGYSVDSVQPWLTNAAPMGWSSSLDRVIYNVRGTDNMFDAYSAKPDGTDPQCLTCTIPSFPTVGAATQRGASDVSPDGRFMLLEVERGQHGGPIGDTIDEPGKGANNDVWLARTDGTAAWPLTDITAPGQTALGTMWARFNRTGTQIVWAELYFPSVLNLGTWRLKVADIVWNGGTPGLRNVKTLEPVPGHFYEPYGFTPDDQHVIFASDLGMPNWWDSQIYTIGVDGSGLTRLSPADAPTGFFTNYNEFAFYLPHDDGIIFGRTRGATTGGIDYWVMGTNGAAPQRLTYLNEAWNSEYSGYTAVGGLAFDPKNPNRFIAGLATDPNAHNLNAVVVTIAPDEQMGLSGQYFSDPGFTQLATTRTENPSSGLKWDAPPVSGMPASGYSVRWSGDLLIPSQGTYSFCVRADGSAKLWIGGRVVIDAPWPTGANVCGSITASAGDRQAIRLDYSNTIGAPFIQLTWVPPDASGSGATPQIIPAADLRPAFPEPPSPPTTPTSPQTTPTSPTTHPSQNPPPARTTQQPKTVPPDRTAKPAAKKGRKPAVKHRPKRKAKVKHRPKRKPTVKHRPKRKPTVKHRPHSTAMVSRVPAGRRHGGRDTKAGKSTGQVRLRNHDAHRPAGTVANSSAVRR